MKPGFVALLAVVACLAVVNGAGIQGTLIDSKSCKAHWQCFKHFYCDKTSKTCKPKKAASERCISNVYCQDNLFCDVSGSQVTCKARKGYSAGCKNDRECKAAFFCKKDGKRAYCEKRYTKDRACTPRHGFTAQGKAISNCRKGLFCGVQLQKVWKESGGSKDIQSVNTFICKPLRRYGKRCSKHDECRHGLFCGKVMRRKVVGGKLTSVTEKACRRRKPRKAICSASHECNRGLFCRRYRRNGHFVRRCAPQVHGGSRMKCTSNKYTCARTSFCSKKGYCVFKGGLDRCNMARALRASQNRDYEHYHPCGRERRKMRKAGMKVSIFCSARRYYYNRKRRELKREKDNHKKTLLKLKIEEAKDSLEKCMKKFRSKSEDLKKLELIYKSKQGKFTLCRSEKTRSIARRSKHLRLMYKRIKDITFTLDKMSCTRVQNHDARTYAKKYLSRLVRMIRQSKGNKLTACIRLTAQNPQLKALCPHLAAKSEQRRKVEMSGQDWCKDYREKVHFKERKFYKLNPCREYEIQFTTARVQKGLHPWLADKKKIDAKLAIDVALKVQNSPAKERRTRRIINAKYMRAKRRLAACKNRHSALFTTSKIKNLQKELKQMTKTLHSSCTIDKRQILCHNYRQLLRVLRYGLEQSKCKKIFAAFAKAHTNYQKMVQDVKGGVDIGKDAQKVLKEEFFKQQDALKQCYEKNKNMLHKSKQTATHLVKVHSLWVKTCQNVPELTPGCKLAEKDFKKIIRKHISAYEKKNVCSKQQAAFRMAKLRLKKGGSAAMTAFNKARNDRLACYKQNKKSMKASIADLQAKIRKERRTLAKTCGRGVRSISRRRCLRARTVYNKEVRVFNGANPCRDEYSAYAISRRSLKSLKKAQASKQHLKKAKETHDKAKKTAVECRRKHRNSIIDKERKLRRLAKYLKRCSRVIPNLKWAHQYLKGQKIRRMRG